MTQYHLTRHSWGGAIFWAALAAFVAFAILAGMGLGPGLLIGAIVLAIYDRVRHERIPTLGYLLLVAAMPVLVYLTLLVAWAREGH